MNIVKYWISFDVAIYFSLNAIAAILLQAYLTLYAYRLNLHITPSSLFVIMLGFIHRVFFLLFPGLSALFALITFSSGGLLFLFLGLHYYLKMVFFSLASQMSFHFPNNTF